MARVKCRQEAMIDTTENLILDLIEWVGLRERTYQETMDAWRTSCPRLPVWEDATERLLVEVASANGCSIVRATSAGLALLREKRPHAYGDLQVPKTLERRPNQVLQAADQMTDLRDRWAAGSTYEDFMGRWSRRLAPRFVSWL